MELSLPPPFILDPASFTINKQPQQSTNHFSSPLPSPSIPLSPSSMIGSNNSTSYIPPPYLQKVPEEQLTATITKDTSDLDPTVKTVATVKSTETKNVSNDKSDQQDKKDDSKKPISSSSDPKTSTANMNRLPSSSTNTTKQTSSTTTARTMTTADIVAAAISKPKPTTGPPATPSEKNKQNVLYMIEFKAGRTDFFYISDNNNMIRPKVGDLVIVEADRGKDLGKVAMNNLSFEQVTLLQSQKNSNNDNNTNNGNNQHDVPLSSSSSSSSSNVITAATTPNDALANTHNNNNDEQKQQVSSSNNNNNQHIKQIYRLAQSDEVNQLLSKKQDEQSALTLCQQKIKQRKLRMDVVDAEYQW